MPAIPASRLDMTHAVVLTRSAFTPASSVIRVLSTTARMRRPTGEYRNSKSSAHTIAIVTIAVARSSRLRNTWPNGLYAVEPSGTMPSGWNVVPTSKNSFTISGSRRAGRVSSPAGSWVGPSAGTGTAAGRAKTRHAEKTGVRHRPGSGDNATASLIHCAGRERLRAEAS
jgi:hypothetical protein